MAAERLYLDNAATSWPKPESVYQAVDRYLRSNGAGAGRGVYREAVEADRLVEGARQRVARLINAPSPRCIVFTLNGTDALNLAIHGVVGPGDHVVTSEAEHNSILRPLEFQKQQRSVQVTTVPCDMAGLLRLDDLRAAVQGSPRLVAVTHASNVAASIQPIDEIAAMARQAGALCLIDAAQSVGHLPIDVQASGIDLLAASGHKGLLGPLGTGFLYVAPGVEQSLLPLRQGGTGTQSDEPTQPTAMPYRYESGNANVAGLAGLSAGLDYLLGEGVAKLQAHEQQLIQQLMAALSDVSAVRWLGPPPGQPRVGLLAFTVEGYDPREFASLLDAHFGIQVRAGLHCAPLIHRRLGVPSTGTVRLSVGPFTTAEEMDQVAAAVREIVAA
jgi:cysteine desulfurase/selenocysteine lyase